MTEPFLFNRAPNPGTTVIAKKFRLTNAQATAFKNSDAMQTILDNIHTKFRTPSSPNVGLHRREMPRPTSDEYFLEYIDKYFIEQGDGTLMLNPARDPPMTPTAYMLQQQVLKALGDVPNGAPWINKAMFFDMVNQPNTFQYAIAPKLNPAPSSRITGDEAYFRHISRIFERFARQDKQDIFIVPAQYFLMPNEPFKRVFRHTGTIPTHERPNLVADRQLLQIMQLDREGDSEGVARMLETTPDLDEPAADQDDDTPEPAAAPASSSGDMIMQGPFYAAGVAPPRVADRAEPTAADLQAAAD